MIGIFDSIFLEDNMASMTIKYDPSKATDAAIMRRAQNQLTQNHEKEARMDQKKRNLGVKRDSDTPVVAESFLNNIELI